MAAEKHSFETKANLSSPVVEIARPDGTLLRIEAGEKFETTDPMLARDLDGVPALKRSEKGSK
jgi:hypothetical protein